MIQNPAFDSQTKECLTTRKNAFGSTCALSDTFMKSVEKSGVVTKILAFAKFKQDQGNSVYAGFERISISVICTKLNCIYFYNTIIPA